MDPYTPEQSHPDQGSGYYGVDGVPGPGAAGEAHLFGRSACEMSSARGEGKLVEVLLQRWAG